MKPINQELIQSKELVSGLCFEVCDMGLLTIMMFSTDYFSFSEYNLLDIFIIPSPE